MTFDLWPWEVHKIYQRHIIGPGFVHILHSCAVQYTTMTLQINCSNFHSLLFGPQQDRVEQLISTEQSWPLCYPWPLILWPMIMTFRGLQDIPETHNLSKFRTDTSPVRGWKTSFCSFSERGSVTEIQFVKSPLAQNEKFKLIWPQEAFYFLLLSFIAWSNN